MNSDPFRALDRIDPADQWDEITRRAEATDDLTVDLDGGAGRGPRRRATALVAAAVVALLGGGLVAARATGGDADGVTADTAVPPTSSTPAPDLGGPCPFTLAGTGIPAPTPYTLPTTPDDFPGLVTTAGRVTVDGIELTVSLGGSTALGEPLLGPVGTRDLGVGPVDSTTGLQSVGAGLVIDDQAPCTDVQISAQVAPSDVEAARAIAERVREAIVVDGVELPAPLPERPEVTQAWGGSLADGRPYEVSIADGALAVTVEGVPVMGSPTDDVPYWDPEVGSTGVAFELSPRPAGQPTDDLLVSVVPPDAVETYLVDGEGDRIPSPSLTFSPDGQLFAVHGLDMVDAGPHVWPIRHRLADGTEVRGIG